MNYSTADLLVESAHDLNQRYADTLTPLIVFLAIMAPIGIMGNIIVLVVYSASKTYKDTNFRIFVLWLAVIDLLSCLTVIPVEIISLRIVYTFDIALLCKMKCFFQVFFNTTTGLALLTIAFERYRKICCPLQWQISRGLANKIVVIVVLFACILCSPAPIMCGISAENKTNIYNTTTIVNMCEVEEKFENTIIRMVFKSAFTVILSVASVTIIVMYGLILRATCLVRRKLIRQNRTIESVKLSASKYDSTCDVNTNNLTREETPVEDSIDINNFEKGAEAKENKKQTNTSWQRGDSELTLGGYQRQSSRFQFTKSPERTKNSPNISGCGLSSKTLIWLILTIVFIVTYFLYTILAYYTTTQYAMSPAELAFYKFLMRIYFVNNVINPVIYVWLDTGFRDSCRGLYKTFKQRYCCIRKQTTIL